MHVRPLIAGLALTPALTLLMLTGAGVATAQEATPDASPITVGVTRQPLTAEAVSHLEGLAGPLIIERLRIPAGAGVTLGPADGALVAVVVERGTLEGASPAAVTIQHQQDGAAATVQEVTAGEAFWLSFGDVLVSLAPAGLQLQTVGDEPASVVQIGIGSDRPLNAPAANVDGQPSGLVMALALVVPPSCPPGAIPEAPENAATPLAGGGSGGSGNVAVALAAAPSCVSADGTPTP